jgi:hypothetical protein
LGKWLFFWEQALWCWQFLISVRLTLFLLARFKV